MKASELKRKYIDFFVKKHSHSEIAGASLIPENDPTVLFTTAGMHPLVPYLMGESHPAGTRLVDCQKCLRTDDIDEVGDDTHCTFFEMLGNWSLGDYFKKEAISMSYEFLTDKEHGLGIDPERLNVSCFAGDNDAPKDEESAGYWEELGFKRASEHGPGPMRIWFYGKKENWWGPAGQTGPCGPDTEMFFDTGKEPCSRCAEDGVDCDCGKYVEIWNDVFMEYNKTADGKYEPLEQKNVDTGLGLERVIALMQGVPTHYDTELFLPVLEFLREKATAQDITEAERIIADHIRAAVFIIGDPKGVMPSNTDQGYVLRRLIRRSIRQMRKIGIDDSVCDVAKIFIDIYPELSDFADHILTALEKEEAQFCRTLHQGEKEFEKILPNLLRGDAKILSGRLAFKLYDTYGFPLEMTKDLAKENGLIVDEEGFHQAFEKHQEMSRAGAEAKFKGGLQDDSAATTALHTATHLLLAALRQVLGDHVYQKGSNITAERLRFDFSHPEAMTDEQKSEVEKLVNEWIEADLEVGCEEMTPDEAHERGAVGVFGERYGNIIKVYTVKGASKEICGGPHVEKTGGMGKFRIKKEQSSSSGVRRIKAVLE
ncbi:alanine--tRNA ligase [Candidatus Peregrinibacteria bacterium CG10_big_fil_rev_8_21_14_0_10_44_7]|nr:MAG: alanine--tRNA ligase [Candidatus Peregrinibacteria bacterium CG2_30_44_17]PIS04100.1 MAG: alanine--tRNA ligase [Candidatus Peregrinibacteria bacterium CG10_big_fil_rev_8_21_14_0_10_44_7]PIX79529.1 MAG: alanine--tRNA ligase [Candidatus Peregrinibacteria bacterium CG_4_10_14_3_um_filter_44_21]PJB88537.1 MAG: alanine--tRNA ligase [Candidatus Peregrinibacteria bacterium CG_4_9_14_0_8_um_filter_44_15]